MGFGEMPKLEGEHVERRMPEYTHAVERGTVTITVRERVLTPGEREEHKITDETPVGIVLSTPDGSTFDLASLLPPGWCFVQQEERPFANRSYMSAAPRRKVISFPRTRLIPRITSFANHLDLEQRAPDSKVRGDTLLQRVAYETHDIFKLNGSMLTLLHEMGHSHEQQQSDLDWLTEIGLRLKSQVKGEAWSDGEIRNFLDRVLTSERGGWAFALENYRKLLKSGIDLEPEMDIEDLLAHVSGHLATYGSRLPVDRDELDAIHREQRIEENRNEKKAA